VRARPRPAQNAGTNTKVFVYGKVLVITVMVITRPFYVSKNNKTNRIQAVRVKNQPSPESPASPPRLAPKIKHKTNRTGPKTNQTTGFPKGHRLPLRPTSLSSVKLRNKGNGSDGAGRDQEK